MKIDEIVETLTFSNKVKYKKSGGKLYCKIHDCYLFYIYRTEDGLFVRCHDCEDEQLKR